VILTANEGDFCECGAVYCYFPGKPYRDCPNLLCGLREPEPLVHVQLPSGETGWVAGKDLSRWSRW
jgi:hypothetical protein